MDTMIVAIGAVVQLLISLLPHSSALNPFSDVVQRQFSAQRLDECFCELRGQIDECCCDVETVDTLNENKIFPLISSLVNRTFFKFFRVNLHRQCPFWPDDGRCVLKDCHVEACSEEELPQYLKGEQASSPPSLVESCDTVSEEERVLSTINSTISMEQREEFSVWQDYDFGEDNFCEVDVDDSTRSQGELLSYVNLRLNPERYTGYSGHSARRVWKAIYQENCFGPQDTTTYPSVLLFDSSQLQSMCLEKRAFFRLISGLHASISIHLSVEYLASSRDSKKIQFAPNLNEFVRRFDSATTKDQGPGWLKNLYFAYLLVLRAVVKAEPYWNTYHFYTGNEIEDRATKREVMEVIKAAKSCSSLFDESAMFTGNMSTFLKTAFKTHFRNISRIMDCVGCDKCRLWGKLQVQGIGTALKILFSTRKNGGPPLHLSRTELVTLFNVLGRLSSSVHSLEIFRDVQAETSLPGSRKQLEL